MALYNSTNMIASPYPSPSPPHFPLERKLKKPLMEKRRRARMNECLDKLKQLLLHIAPHQRSKLEKADILEMTVAYLNQLHQSPKPSTFDSAASYRQSYAEGFSVAASACLNYIQGTILSSDSSPQTAQFRLGLMQHLQSVMASQLRAPVGEQSPLIQHHSQQRLAPNMTSGDCGSPLTPYSSPIPVQPSIIKIASPVHFMEAEGGQRSSTDNSEASHASCQPSPVSVSDDSFCSRNVSPVSAFTVHVPKRPASPPRLPDAKVWRPF